MKKLTIYPENSEPVVTFDEPDPEDTKLNEKISSLFQVSKVSILETSTAKVFVRPGKITAIKVEDVVLPTSPDEAETEPEQKKEEPKAKSVKPKEPEEDIITDVD